MEKQADHDPKPIQEESAWECVSDCVSCEIECEWQSEWGRGVATCSCAWLSAWLCALVHGYVLLCVAMWVTERLRVRVRAWGIEVWIEMRLWEADGYWVSDLGFATIYIYIYIWENLAFCPYLAKNLAICPCLQTI